MAGDAQSPPAAQRPRSLESLLPSQVGLSPIAASQTPRSGQAHPATPPRNFVPVTPITSDHERLLLIFRGANAGTSYVIRAALNFQAIASRSDMQRNGPDADALWQCSESLASAAEPLSEVVGHCVLAGPHANKLF